MTCGRAREGMVEALYGELDGARARALEEHLRSCAACSAEYDGMRATAALMRERRRPDPGEAYWSSYGERLEARLRADSNPTDIRIGARRRLNVSWGYRVAAAVAVLVAGVWLGRFTVTRDAGHGTGVETSSTSGPVVSSNPPAGGPGLAHDATGSARSDSSDAVAARRGPIDRGTARAGGTRTGDAGTTVLASTDARARRYIERSQILLLGLVNADSGATDAGTADFRAERARASELVSEGAALQDALSSDPDRRLRALVGELELILREIANLEADNDLDAVQVIRNRVDREGVLLQINVEQMRSAPDDTARSRRKGAID